VNAVAPGESDLAALAERTAVTRLGEAGTDAGARGARPLAWLLAALALAAAGLNWLLERRRD
jgi:hypothetical protein